MTSMTSPSLRASTGILKPNSRMLDHMRSTAFFGKCHPTRGEGIAESRCCASSAREAKQLHRVPRPRADHQ